MLSAFQTAATPEQRPRTRYARRNRVLVSKEWVHSTLHPQSSSSREHPEEQGAARDGSDGTGDSGCGQIQSRGRSPFSLRGLSRGNAVYFKLVSTSVAGG